MAPSIATPADDARTAQYANQLARTCALARVGSWVADLSTGAVSWSDEACRLLEFPPDHRPSLDESVRYITEASRVTLARALAEAVALCKAWELELTLVSARGRAIRVRAWGMVDFQEGEPVRMINAVQPV